MSSNSSTRAHNGSVKSSTPHTDTESVNTHSSSSSSTSSSTNAVEDISNLSSDRIADFVNNPVESNPTYTNSSADAKSAAAHRAAMKHVINDFDAVMTMTKGRKNNKEGEGK